MDFKPFTEFMKALRVAQFNDFVGKPNVLVNDEKEFLKMKNHLLKKYEGVEVMHSYIMDDGRVCDCIPMHQQQGLRNNTTVAQPPSIPNHPPKREKDKNVKVTAPESVSDFQEEAVPKQRQDSECQKGYIPVIRLTLEHLTTFNTLDELFRK